MSDLERNGGDPLCLLLLSFMVREVEGLANNFSAFCSQCFKMTISIKLRKLINETHFKFQRWGSGENTKVVCDGVETKKHDDTCSGSAC